MLTLLKRQFSATVYVGITRRELLIRNASSGKTLRWPAAIALDSAGRIITAVGAEAVTRAGGQTHWPFDHPRIVIADFLLAQKLLQAALRELFGGGSLRPTPVLVVQSLDDWEMGLSQIERRALCELAHGAGASEVFLWQGAPPSDNALRSGEFKRSAQLLKP